MKNKEEVEKMIEHMLLQMKIHKENLTTYNYGFIEGLRWVLEEYDD